VDFPWCLRVSHSGGRTLLCERSGRRIVFDPAGPPRRDDIVVLTGGGVERLMGAASAGDGVTMVGPPAALRWLAARGAIDGRTAPVTIDGVAIETRAYPQPRAPQRIGLRAAAHPVRVARRVATRLQMPRVPPVVVRLTLPTGQSLVHLDLALHDALPEDWLTALVAAWRGADWLVTGVAAGQGDAVLEGIARMASGRVLLTDLTSAARQAVGLPTDILTPLCDRAQDAGIPAGVLVEGVGFRFERG